MAKLQVKKRGNVYQYVFEIAPVNGVRKMSKKEKTLMLHIELEMKKATKKLFLNMHGTKKCVI